VTLTGDEIVSLCLDLGFALAGVCPAAPSEHEAELRQWLAQGKHGSMDYLASNTEVRLDTAKMQPGARSIIMVADQYSTRPIAPIEKPDSLPTTTQPVGKIARYAQGNDYHVVMKRRLHQLCDSLRQHAPEHEFRAFVDTAPVLEREHAARAGLGWIGKHTLLIHPERGSWLLLGGILTTLPIEAPTQQHAVRDHCGTCTRCIDACPTSAITPYSVYASKCISYLTIERRLPIDESFDEQIGEWIFGCDICQEVCPHNSPRAVGADLGEMNEAYSPTKTGFDLLDVLGWSEDDRRRQFKSSSLKRATLDMVKRNAIIAAGNHLASQSDPALRQRVESIAHDTDQNDFVRDAAQRVVRK
jgi:epoxyqueuosine reductase